MIYISTTPEPERNLGIRGVLNIAAGFALAVTVGLVSYASLWIW